MQVNQAKRYVQGVTYAIQKLGALPNVAVYLDIAHSGYPPPRPLPAPSPRAPSSPSSPSTHTRPPEAPMHALHSCLCVDAQQFQATQADNNKNAVYILCGLHVG